MPSKPLAHFTSNVVCFNIRNQLLGQTIMLCQLDKAINNVANWEERYSFQPFETKLSKQTFSQLSFTAKLPYHQFVMRQKYFRQKGSWQSCLWQRSSQQKYLEPPRIFSPSIYSWALALQRHGHPPPSVQKKKEGQGKGMGRGGKGRDICHYWAPPLRQARHKVLYTS